MKLKGLVALITGGTTGIGFATARLFMEEGAQVVVTGRNPETLAEARKQLGDGALVIESNTSSPDDIAKLAAQIKDKFGRVDIVFANAGVGLFAPVDQVTEAFFDNMFNVNVKGLYFTIQAMLPLMPDGGAILLNASVAASKGFPGGSVYSATKAAVRSFGRTLAAELAPRRIRVNTISPGPIATPILSKMGLPAEAQKEMETNMAQTTALKRVGRPEEIARVALFLASDDSSYMLGAELLVDGGMVDL